MIARWIVVAVSAVALAGCAGGDGGGAGSAARPSAEKLADAIRGGSSGLGVGDEAADCVAGVLFDSDMSDDALRRYTGENDAETLDDADDAAFAAFIDEAEDTCGISRGGG